VGLLSAAGQCEHGVCVCPPGYNGYGAWSASSECSVKITRLTTMAKTNLLGSSFLLAFSATYLLYLVNWWYIGPWRARRREAERSAKSPGQTYEFGSQHIARHVTSQSRHERASQRRSRLQRLNAVSIFLFMCFGIGGMLYYLPYVQGRRRFDGNAVQDLGVCIMSCSFFSAIYNLAFMWYLNLPSFRQYLAILDPSNFFIKHGSFIRVLVLSRWAYVALVHSALAFLAIHGFGFSSTAARYRLDTGLMVSSAILTGDFLFFVVRLTGVLLEVFRSIWDVGPTLGKSVISEEAYRHTMRSIRGLRWATIIFASLVIPQFLILALVPSVRENAYAWFDLILLSATACALVAIILIHLRLKGYHDIRGDQQRAVHPTVENSATLVSGCSKRESSKS